MANVGVWEPKKPVQIDVDTLQRLVGVMAVAGDDVAGALSAEDIEIQAPLMQQSEDAWQAAQALGDGEIEALIRFFTLAEMQLPGWEGGKKSPVIYLVRIMKERGTFTGTLRRWIKAHTDNRYLPYGSVL